MAQFRTTADILDEILQKSGEPTNGSSPYETLAITFANKVHQAIVGGGNVFNLDVDEPWTWARARYPIVLELQPAYVTGTIAAIQNTTNMSFSTAPTASLEGWFIQPAGKTTVYRITQHTAGALEAQLDSSWVDSTGAYKFRAFKLEYDISPAYIILDNSNDRLDFQEGTAFTTRTASLTHGSYSFAALIAHVVTQMDTPATATITGAYDSVLRSYSLTCSSSLKLLGATGANAKRSGLPTVGFDRIDYTGAQAYTSAYTPNSVCRLIEPFRIFSDADCTQVKSTDTYNMEFDYPLLKTAQRVPDRFAKIAEANDGAYTVRFNAYPKGITKVYIDWIPMPIDLQDNAVSTPLIPREDIDVLVNGASMYILWRKSDTKFADVKGMAEVQLQAMQKKNRSELSRTGHTFGQIVPRQDLTYPVRRVDYGYTTSGSSGATTETPILDFVYDQASTTLVYEGWAATGSSQSAAVWRVKKVVISAGDTVTVTYADGDTLFNNVWANRASLSYS